MKLKHIQGIVIEVCARLKCIQYPYTYTAYIVVACMLAAQRVVN